MKRSLLHLFDSDGEYDSDSSDSSDSSDLTRLPTEVKENIYRNLSYRDTQSLATVNKQSNAIIKNEVYWESLIKSKYGSRVHENKPAHISYRQQYTQLKFADWVTEIPNNGRVDFLYAYIKKYQDRPEFRHNLEDIVDDSVQHGHLRILQIGSQILGTILPEFYTAAAFGNRLHILNWLFQNNVPIDDQSADMAIEGKSWHALGWLVPRGVFPTDQGYRELIDAENVPTLHYLQQNGMDMTQEGLDYAYLHGKDEVVEWAISRFQMYPRNFQRRRR